MTFIVVMLTGTTTLIMLLLLVTIHYTIIVYNVTIYCRQCSWNKYKVYTAGD